MKKNTNEMLVKHHFWFLGGGFLLLLLVGFIIMWAMSAGAAKAANDEREKVEKDIKGASPKGQSTLDKLDDQKKRLDERTNALWKQNYDRQKESHVFDWPTGGNSDLARFEKADFPFGTLIQTPNNELEPRRIRDAFAKSYEKLTETVAPTRYAGGQPNSVLRTVSNWGEKTLTTDHLWLAIEDFWVQRALLTAIIQVNNDAALFQDVTPPPADNPLKRTFRSKVWELDLEVVTQGANKTLTGKLRNRTPRLQMIGANKEMIVKVWFDDPKLKDGKPTIEPYRFRIEGETVRGFGELPVKLDKKAHLLNGKEHGIDPEKIYRVEQTLDEATVPVRQLQRVQLNGLDHKRMNTPLVSLKKWGDEPASEAAPPAGGLGEGGALGGPGAPGPAGLGMGPGGPGAGLGGGRAAAPAGSADAVLLGNKKRYVESTGEVRRIPVSLAVVVDVDFANDFLVALANSPLRFQVTQSQWQRFRGDLATVAPTAPTGPGPGVGEGEGFGEGGAAGVPPRPGGGIPGGAPAGPGAGIPGGAPPAASTGVDSNTQIANGGLVELAVYGVVSLYEKYVPKETEKKDGEGEKKDGEGEKKEGEGEKKEPDADAKKGTGEEKPPVPPKEPVKDGTPPATDPKKEAEPKKDGTPAPTPAGK